MADYFDAPCRGSPAQELLSMGGSSSLLLDVKAKQRKCSS
jgi:hypothetical protein